MESRKTERNKENREITNVTNINGEHIFLAQLFANLLQRYDQQKCKKSNENCVFIMT